MSSDDRIILTLAGYEKMERELDRLRTLGRRQVADRIRESKQFGDIAENSEFEEAKLEQAFVEGRIREIQQVLQIAHVVEPDDVSTDTVGIGSIVTVSDAEFGETWEFTIVGSIESDPDNDRISDESPVGRAVMDRKVGDEVTVAAPDGRIRYRVESIRK